MSKLAMLWMFTIYLFAILGGIMASILAHESLHFDGDGDEAMCFDFTGKAFAYVTHKGSMAMDEYESALAEHYEIYFIHGAMNGTLLLLISMGFIFVMFKVWRPQIC